MPPLFMIATSARPAARCASAMSRPNAYSSPARFSGTLSRATTRSLMLRTACCWRPSASVNATSGLTWSAYGVTSWTRTSRRPPVRTKSTTPIERPLDCASTMGMPWTTVLTRDVENLAVTGARIAGRPHVRHDDHEVGPGARLRQKALDRLGAVTEHQALDVARWGARRCLRRRQADHGDLHAVLRHQLPWRRPVRPRRACGIRDICREERVFRVGHARAQRIDRPIELVIADRRGVDAQRVHGVDRPAPKGGVRQQRPLHLVAGVEPHRGAATDPGKTVEPRLQRRHAADRPAL